MKVQLESTTKIVQLSINGVDVPARVWEGRSAGGVPVIAFIPRIAAERDADLSEFTAELAEQSVPSVMVDAWPLRMVLD